ncbi:MAG: RNA polymerase sigma factor [Roseburia sp.]|nr:RNA polymerase sigma factor [Roseburia sp.]MCM1279754.1 RNA polymerase sigma factor [Robinsoniella sp.]
MNESDFGAIYEKYVSKVFAFVMKLSGNSDIAEEITQETFVRAYISLRSFRGECRLEVWLCQIAKNLFYDIMKNRKRELNINLKMKADSGYDYNIENQMIMEEEAGKLKEVIASLKEPYRSVIIDCVFLELSYKEMAMKYQKTENWARVTCYRAKQKVKEKFQLNLEGLL